jgi:N-acetylneuraminic acid mutarotase
MNKGIVLLITVFLTTLCLSGVKPAFSFSVAAAEDTWTAKAPMQVARVGLGVAAVNGKIYAIGGTHDTNYPPSGALLGTNEEYNPETDTWKTKAPMPTPRDYFAIAAYQNKIYCIGGAVGYTVDQWGFWSYVTSGVTEVYDTVTDTWETKTPMPDVGMQIQAHVVDGRIYVMDWSSGRVYVYDPQNDSWTSKTRMPQSLFDYASSKVSAVVDNKIIVTFEIIHSAITGYSSSEQKVMIYDTETDSWSEGTSGPSLGGVGSVAAATVGVNALQRVYVLRWGVNQVYDPEADVWATAAAMPTSRIDFGVAVVDDVLYAIGGYTTVSRYGGQPVAVNERYIPIGYGVPPEIIVHLPVNQLYNESSVFLNFTVNKPVNWTGYSLDGDENVTVTGNTSLTGLSAALHNVTVYAKDEFGNTGTSETIIFNVAEEPFPIVPVATASVAVVTVVGVGLLVYFKKRKR